MIVALSIGHHPQAQGCDLADGQFTEYSFWEKHLPLLKQELEALGHGAYIVNRSDAGGRTPSCAAAACNVTAAELAIEFHFNSSDDPAASGTETFYWATSAKGKLAATIIQRAMVQALGLRDRGIKGVSDPKANAYEYYRKTRMPALLVEPSFAASSKEDCRRLRDRIHCLIRMLALAINECEKAMGQ